FAAASMPAAGGGTSSISITASARKRPRRTSRHSSRPPNRYPERMSHRLLTILILAASAFPIHASDPPLQALQDQVRKLIDAAEPGVAAVVVSTNPNYPSLSDAERKKPGYLGSYQAAPAPTDGIVAPTRDKLDLSDPRSAAENNFGSGLVLDA